MKKVLHTYHVVFEDGQDLAVSDTEAPSALNRLLGMNPDARPVEFYQGSKFPYEINGKYVSAAWLPLDLPPSPKHVEVEKHTRTPQEFVPMFNEAEIKAESRKALSRK